MKAGDIGLVKMSGPVGVFIRLGQFLCGKGFRDYQHAFVCVEVQPNGMISIVQAMPQGAELAGLNPRVGVLWSDFSLSEWQREKIVKAALGYVGTPYSFLDYFALAYRRLRIPVPWLRWYIKSTGHMICSQLVDRCYLDAGVHLFKDGRWSGDVMPADLANLILEND